MSFAFLDYSEIVCTYITIFHTLTLTTPPPQKYYVTPSHTPTHPHMNNILSQEPPSTPPCAWENLLLIQGPTQPHCKHSQYKLSLWKSIAVYSCACSCAGEVQCMWNGDCSAKAEQARWGTRGIVEQALNGSPTYFNSKELSHWLNDISSQIHVICPQYHLHR